MTPKELLGWSVDDLEKLSTEELEKIFSPFYKVTRPQQKAQPPSGTLGGPIKNSKPPKKLTATQKEKDVMEKARKLMEQHGLKL